MAAEYYITDGTSEIWLIQPAGATNPIRLKHWIARSPQMKGGGSYAQSSFSDSRRLVDYRWATVIEPHILTLSDVDQNSLIFELQELRRLLIKATDYWVTDWQNEPVWIVAKAANETNRRYAFIRSWDTPDDANPFAQPFLGAGCTATIPEFVLNLERTHWTDTPPNEITCLPINTRVDYNALGGNYYDTDGWRPIGVNDDCTNLSIAPFSLILLAFGDQGVGVGDCDAGIRFRNVEIPQGVTILRAHCRFYSSGNWANNTVRTNIYGQDSDDNVEFVNAADYVARPRTTAFVPWDNHAAWFFQQPYETPDIASVIQEIVDRTGWTSGNNLVVFIEDDGSDVGAQRSAIDDGEALRAHLFVEWLDETGGTRSTYGRANTCLEENFVVNFDLQVPLTHIFVFENGVGYGPNLLTTWDETGTIALLPNVPAADDAIYFGISYNVNDKSHPRSLIFDLAAGASGVTLEWQYYDAVFGWEELDYVCDHTADLTNTGVEGLFIESWRIQDAQQFLVNGVTAYWLRAVVTGVAAPTPPYQQNRHIYTVHNSFIDSASANLGGDLPALIHHTLTNKCVDGDRAKIYRILAGLRSYDRGADFRACINVTDNRNNPAGMTITKNAGGQFTWTSIAPYDTILAQWEVLQWLEVATADTWFEVFTVSFTTALAQQYLGRFRAILTITTAAADQLIVRLRCKIGERETFVGDSLLITELGDQIAVDLGEFSFPGTDFTMDDPFASAEIILDGQVTDLNDIFLFHTLHIIPADEWFGDYSTVPEPPDYDGFTHPDDESYLSQLNAIDRYLTVDPYVRKFYTRPFARETDADIYAVWKKIQSNEPLLHPNKRQRLHFLMIGFRNSVIKATHPRYMSVMLKRWQKYSTMRGAR